MEIKNKGQLVQAYVDSDAEVQKLTSLLSSEELKKSALALVIGQDESLMKMLVAGGITAHGSKVLLIGDDGLRIGNVEVGILIKDELTSEQLEIINE